MENIKLLLIDDEEELVYPMSERLELRGFEVKVATHWKSALKFFDDQTFDVAVVDIKLPGMNGMDLMKMLFQLQPDLKVILMSGHATEDDTKLAKSLGASDLMIKPIKMVNLINHINEILSNE